MGRYFSTIFAMIKTISRFGKFAFEQNIIEHKNARKVFDPDVIKTLE